MQSKYSKLFPRDAARTDPKTIETPKAFNYADLQPKTFAARLLAKLVRFMLQPVFGMLRRFRPIAYIAGIYAVTRDRDVREILGHPDIFLAPFGPEMEALAPVEKGEVAGFVLGMDGADHDRQLAIIRSVMRKEDAENIRSWSAEYAQALVMAGGGRLDIVTDLITRTSTQTLNRYFGLEVKNPEEFAHWSIAVSTLLFADPTGSATTRAVAQAAAVRLGEVIDDAINRADRNSNRSDDSLIDRLVTIKKAQNSTVTNGEIRSIILGMVCGSVPTNTLSATKMIEQLLREPKAMKGAKHAARSENRDALKRYLLEAARLNPALAPGQWRYVAQDYLLGQGTRYARMIPKGSTVLVSTMAAMRDTIQRGENFPHPNKFDPERATYPDLVFGADSHRCVAEYIAMDIITETFMALFSAHDLRPAKGKFGKLQWAGVFPDRLDMVYASNNGDQSMFLIVAPVESNISEHDLFTLINRDLGYPAHDKMKQALDATGGVHFGSLTCVNGGSDAKPALKLIFELSVDGDIVGACNAIAEHAGALLAPIFVHSDMAADGNLAEYLKRHVVTLDTKLRGATGLNFSGMGEFSLHDIDRQQKLAAIAQGLVDEHLRCYAWQGNRAMRTLRFVRRAISQDSDVRSEASRSGHTEIMRLMDAAKEAQLGGYLVIPSRKSKALFDWQEPKSIAEMVRRFFASKASRSIIVPMTLLFAAFFYLFFTNLSFAMDSSCSLAHNCATTLIVYALRAFFITTFYVVVVIAALLGLFLAILRFKELRDPVDVRAQRKDMMLDFAKQEDHPGFAVNHMMAMGQFKRGRFRLLSHWIALWGIKQVVTFAFRPGFIKKMGTIHYARWVHLPGTDKGIFFSNYNGSWDSYLEDFINRVPEGMSAAWSNWRGFPKTKFLIGQGTRDGDAFKRWVRLQQQRVPFWYARYPALTTDQIRNHALIHHGLARAASDSEARDWLRCFGAGTRTDNILESDEIQTIVLSGMRHLPSTACIAIRLPKYAEDMSNWMRLLSGQDANLPQRGYAGVPIDGIIEVAGDNPYGPSGRWSLDKARQVNFGDSAHKTGCCYLAFSAEGFGAYKDKTPRRGNAKSQIPTAFPMAFQLGMAQRANIVGDAKEDWKNWRWADHLGGDSQNCAHAILQIYAKDNAEREAALSTHIALLEAYGATVVSKTLSAQAAAGPDHEHFGFRDGISQPIIRGSRRFAKGAVAKDIVEPGEFILGYANGQGFFPPSPLIDAEADARQDLALPGTSDLSRYPDFGREDAASAFRDFGRNGSYMIVRELAQDVDGFAAMTKAKAQEIKEKYQDLTTIAGQEIDADWVAAKMMGRWQDGRPLVGNPVQVPAQARKDDLGSNVLDNDFNYGSDDPLGLACPLGAHIRRSYPRESLSPGDAAESAITNRHRILRRGRTYARTAGEGADEEKGILFVALCADIERQFEFVQQTWVNSPHFHGLQNEPDPFAANSCPMAGNFSIPTSAGTIRLDNIQSHVRVKAGGYFFLPGRASLLYMINRLLN